MKLFSFFKKTKSKEQIKDTISDETGYVCGFCGTFNPMSFKFCPNCGKERFSRPNNKRMDSTQPIVQVTSPEDRITVYLRKKGLLHLADKQYLIQIQLENGNLVRVPLIGRQNSNDALEYLTSKQLLSKKEIYRFPDWPLADPCIGPWYHHVSACVCELDTRKIYHVIGIEMKDMRLLYGCPNAKSIIQSNLIDNAKVEIIDYES